MSTIRRWTTYPDCPKPKCGKDLGDGDPRGGGDDRHRVAPFQGRRDDAGSVVGGDWCSRSSRDPEQIRRWWADNPNYGIALHVGRSGAVAFDLDGNSLFRSADAILFQVPEDGQFSNSATKFDDLPAGMGAKIDVRGQNGVIVTASVPEVGIGS